MATIHRSTFTAAASSTAAQRSLPVRVSAPRTRSSVVVSAAKDAVVVSRREAMGAAVALSAALFSASPAQAFLGFDDGTAIKEKYVAETTMVLGKVKDILDLPRGDESKDAKVKDLRKDINSWVAAYRREPLVSGRPSYGNTYSALNALAGHYNNFGTTAPVPKKRLERLRKELDDASLFLSRGR